MYWDILEVKAVNNHGLWLRFADGMTGIVQLDFAGFAGVLEPLRDPEFFAKVVLEHGAPTWPGEIDLAPDALYRKLRNTVAAPAPAYSHSELGS